SSVMDAGSSHSGHGIEIRDGPDLDGMENSYRQDGFPAQSWQVSRDGPPTPNSSRDCQSGEAGSVGPIKPPPSSALTVRGKGGGGPNQEFALALAPTLGGARRIAALAGDTDGTDGGSGRPEDPAGAFVDATMLARARRLGLDPAHFLDDNNSTGFFERL